MTATVVFYEKPGCLSNTRQKALLSAAGHRLDVRDLLAETWTAARLRAFFGTRPVAEWFNPSAPSVNSGEICPEELDESAALTLMLAEPLLIRRPLIEIPAANADGVLRTCGFESGPVLAALGIHPDPAEDLQSCSKPGPEAECPYPGGP